MAATGAWSPPRHGGSAPPLLLDCCGLTLVPVTHDSSIARRAQRLGTMRHGKLTVEQTV
jgi:hypothetical protein